MRPSVPRLPRYRPTISPSARRSFDPFTTAENSTARDSAHAKKPTMNCSVVVTCVIMMTLKPNSQRSLRFGKH